MTESAVDTLERLAFFGGLFTLLAVLLAIKAGCIAVNMWYVLARPAAVAHLYRIYQERPKRCFIVGFINAAFGAFLILVLLNANVLALLGILLLLWLTSMTIVGYGAAYYNLGRRFWPADSDASPVRIMLYGGMACEIAFLTPGLGQLLSIYVLCRGLG
ncbi:MAG: hypothetical protein KJ052_02600, partial [Candidatus Hydrogenedentes bacterium]|nr:hypothetical protein [Candidatus Hydrogenedentota bacterium]